ETGVGEPWAVLAVSARLHGRGRVLHRTGRLRGWTRGTPLVLDACARGRRIVAGARDTLVRQRRWSVLRNRCHFRLWIASPARDAWRVAGVAETGGALRLNRRYPFRRCIFPKHSEIQYPYSSQA